MKLRKCIAILSALLIALSACSLTAFADSSDVDLGSGFDLRFDGEDWKVFPVESKEDALYADDLNITVVDPDGEIVPEDAYELVFGKFYWDDEAQEDVFIEISEPFSLTMDADYMQSGFGGFAACAVAKDGSGYTGRIDPREFMLWHKYSFNWFGANADFGEEYRGQSMWSWHDYFEIPTNEIKEPVIHGIAYEDVDPEFYEITYFERGEQPDFDDPEYDQKLYPETDPLAGLPTQPGKYFARIDGKAPYYGTSYVDFDVTEAVPNNDFSKDVELRFRGEEEWAQDYYLDGKNDTLTLEELDITVVTLDGDVIPADQYELHIGIETGYDDEKREPIIEPVEEPFGLTSDEAQLFGWQMHCVTATAIEGGDYVGETRVYEFMLRDWHSLERDSVFIDFGERYLKDAFRSWHYYYEIPEGEIKEPDVYNSLREKLDASQYTLTYFERGEQSDFDDPEYDQKLYPETDPLEELPTQPGKYFARIDGKEPYYGTSYVDFDIVEQPEAFAMVRGSDKRYYDGDTIYLNKDEDIYVRFDLDPYKEGIIPGWRNDLFVQDGFTIDEAPSFFEDDDYAYAHIRADGLEAGASGTLYYSLYRVEDVFDMDGNMHWDTAVPVKNCSVNITVVSDGDALLLGDADGDGEVTILDVTYIQRQLASIPTPAFYEEAADVDGDGEVAIIDATHIQRWLASIPSIDRIGEPIG